MKKQSILITQSIIYMANVNKFDLDAELKGVKPFINPVNDTTRSRYEPTYNEYNKAVTDAVLGKYDLFKRIIVTQRNDVESTRNILQTKLDKLQTYEEFLTKLMKK